MTKDQLEKLINDMDVGDEYTIKTSSFSFGLKCMKLLGSVVIVFGGYGSHFITLDTDTYDSDEIATEIEKHVGGYHSEISDWLTIEEFELV